jgi:hypothetical protein
LRASFVSMVPPSWQGRMIVSSSKSLSTCYGWLFSEMIPSGNAPSFVCRYSSGSVFNIFVFLVSVGILFAYSKYLV